MGVDTIHVPVSLVPNDQPVLRIEHAQALRHVVESGVEPAELQAQRFARALEHQTVAPGGDDDDDGETVGYGRTEAEAIALANATDYGLATSIWTQDLSAAHRMAGAIEVGLCWINSWFLRDLRTAFGGAKASGIGREGGVHSLEFYTELRNVMVKL